MTSSSLSSARGSSFFNRRGSMGTFGSGLALCTPPRQGRFLGCRGLAVLEEREAGGGTGPAAARFRLRFAGLGVETKAPANGCQGAVCLVGRLRAGGGGAERIPRLFEVPAARAKSPEKKKGAPVSRVQPDGPLQRREGLLLATLGQLRRRKKEQALGGLLAQLAHALERPLGDERVPEDAGGRAQVLEHGRARNASGRGVANERHRLVRISEQRVAQAGG